MQGQRTSAFFIANFALWHLQNKIQIWLGKLHSLTIFEFCISNRTYMCLCTHLVAIHKRSRLLSKNICAQYCLFWYYSVLVTICYSVFPLFHYENLNKFSAKYEESMRNHSKKVHYCHMTKRGTSKKAKFKNWIIFQLSNNSNILSKIVSICYRQKEYWDGSRSHKIINPNNTTWQKLTVFGKKCYWLVSWLKFY